MVRFKLYIFSIFLVYCLIMLCYLLYFCVVVVIIVMGLLVLKWFVYDMIVVGVFINFLFNLLVYCWCLGDVCNVVRKIVKLMVFVKFRGGEIMMVF